MAARDANPDAPLPRHVRRGELRIERAEVFS
jgi:hypothetical protein